MVAGSGRSGTSLLAGIVAQLGLYVPQPEISTDSSNPLGFSEPAWVVEFNDRLLRRELVEVSDARPEAWFTTTRLSAQPRARLLLFEWLKLQFEQADELVIKDPRLSWFLGMWRAGVLRTGAQPSFATMLRHPTEVVSSKSQQYPGPAGNTNRTAAWLNLMLFTERATRGSLRTFIEYDDLLDDWARVVRPMGDALGLRSISAAKTDDLRRVEAFVRPSLRGSHGGWDGLGVTGPVRDLAEEAWTQLRSSRRARTPKHRRRRSTGCGVTMSGCTWRPKASWLRQSTPRSPPAPRRMRSWPSSNASSASSLPLDLSPGRGNIQSVRAVSVSLVSDDLEMIAFTSPQALWAWLDEHHLTPPGGVVRWRRPAAHVPRSGSTTCSRPASPSGGARAAAGPATSRPTSRSSHRVAPAAPHRSATSPSLRGSRQPGG